MIVTQIEILIEISLLERIWVLVIVLHSIVKEVLIGRERKSGVTKSLNLRKLPAYYKLVWLLIMKKKLYSFFVGGWYRVGVCITWWFTLRLFWFMLTFDPISWIGVGSTEQVCNTCPETWVRIYASSSAARNRKQGSLWIWWWSGTIILVWQKHGGLALQIFNTSPHEITGFVMRYDDAKSQLQSLDTPPQKSIRFCIGIENSQPRHHDLRSLCLANLAIKRIESDQLLCQFTSIVESCGWNKKKRNF